MSKLDFEAYFEAVHEHPPFPWQVRLASRVVQSGAWPSLLDLPTGVGKTTALDIALFAMAARKDAPRRVFLVVDRRIIVDQGAKHAKKILDALEAGAAPDVKEALLKLWGGKTRDAPFEVAVLRGGLPRDGDWAKRPDQPVLGLSTVDQVGSRLLFRGYGVSARMAPIHAGLLGRDALFLLDEVHLAQPFAETLAQLQLQKGSDPKRGFQVVQMSATPGEKTEDAFELGEADRENEVIDRRLTAEKPTVLREITVRGEEASRRETFGRKAAEHAHALIKEGAKTVGIVVNRVDTARHACLTLAKDDGIEVKLLTGRMRGLDRDKLLGTDEVEGLLARAGAGAEISPDAKPYVVVATQTIEAGADLDFDALVTECASYDALKQRFGRLNRRGEQSFSKAVVLIRSDQVKESDKDPVYGPALNATWKMLKSKEAGLDFSIEAREHDELKGLLVERKRAPIILPEYVNAWAQTAPVPDPDPDVALWLHGDQDNAPEVQVVWRSEITEETLEKLADTESAQPLRDFAAILAACRPAPSETLSVPLYAAKAWLQKASESEISDTVGTDLEDEFSRRRTTTKAQRSALRWSGSEVELVAPNKIRPGDTLIVPCERGGITDKNWDPGSRELVSDLGDLAQVKARRRTTLRLRPAALQSMGLSEALAAQAPAMTEDDDQDLKQEVEDWLEDVRTKAVPADLRDILDTLASEMEVVSLPDDSVVLISKKDRPGVSTEDDDSAFTSEAVSLDAHSGHVEAWAERFVSHLNLPKALAEDICLAGFFHDVGKADPRFQRWLQGGSELPGAQVLAKSGGSSRDRRQREAARRRAGYPSGERHELLSTALLEANESVLAKANDRDLVLHLVGSHHGWCRPFAPALDPEDDFPVRVTLKHETWGEYTLTGGTRHRSASLNSPVEGRFWRLNKKYGHWTLAWLEAVVRLADHRASETGAKP